MICELCKKRSSHRCRRRRKEELTMSIVGIGSRRGEARVADKIWGEIGSEWIEVNSNWVWIINGPQVDLKSGLNWVWFERVGSGWFWPQSGLISTEMMMQREEERFVLAAIVAAGCYNDWRPRQSSRWEMQAGETAKHEDDWSDWLKRSNRIWEQVGEDRRRYASKRGGRERSRRGYSARDDVELIWDLDVERWFGL